MTRCKDMQELKPIKEGKVREIYDNGDSLIMVATDRISCFDVILNNEVTKKGTVLTQMSKFWFDLTEDILPNHMISVDVKDMPEFFQQEKYDGKFPIWVIIEFFSMGMLSYFYVFMRIYNRAIRNI